MKDAKGHGSEKRDGSTIDTVYSSRFGVGGLGKGMYARTKSGQHYKLNPIVTNGKIPRVGSFINPSAHTAVQNLSAGPAASVAAQHGIGTSHLAGYLPPTRSGDQSPTHNSRGHEWGSPAALADFKAEHGGPANKGQLARIARFRKAVGRGE